MAYLYNNKRIYEYERRHYVMEEYHTQLEKVKGSIEELSSVLRANDISKELGSSTKLKAGFQLDILECKEKIESIKKKIEYVKRFKLEGTKHVGILEKLYLWLLTRINTVAFIKPSELRDIKNELEKGAHVLPDYVVDYYSTVYIQEKTKILAEEKEKLNYLETGLIAELNPEEVKKATILDPESPVHDIKNKVYKKPLTKQIVIDILFLLLKILYTSSNLICYLAMIIAHAYYGNLLSLVYPLGVLGYALLVRCRPHGNFWRIMLIYSGVVIVLKYMTSIVQDFLINYSCAGISRINCTYAAFFDSLQANVIKPIIRRLEWLAIGPF